ncbi:MAG: hypothetical protein QM526_01560 [Alphaproteobacteria bacterium]|nr:hypothetical protein [Alphaproteobacteria bacterium]
MANKNILYWLGAGASANAIPCVNEMVERLELLWAFLKFELHHNEQTSQDINDFLSDYLAFINEIKEHKTVDTYFKFLYFTNNSDIYRKYKLILALFFYFEESCSDKDIFNHFEGVREKKSNCFDLQNYLVNVLKPEQDKEKLKVIEILCRFYSAYQKNNEKNIPNKTSQDQRYINFLLDICGNKEMKPKFPKNIKIISWNYDGQLEIAFNKLQNDPIIYPKPLTLTRSLIYNKQHYKINGNVTELYPLRFNSLSLDTFIKEWTNMLLNPRGTISLINFAWENSSKNRNTKLSKFLWSGKDAKNLTAAQSSQYTDVVIIGYSFPFSNKDVDQDIIGILLHSSSQLQQLKFHIQCPLEDYAKYKKYVNDYIDSSISIKYDVGDKNRPQIVYAPFDNKNFYIPR